eukprot:4009_1
MSTSNDDNPIKAPKIKVSDIFVPAAADAQNIITETPNTSTSSTLGDPSIILDDWLYLGNRWHSQSRDLLQRLNITHVLNITATIPCSFHDIIQYAHIKAFDESSVKLYEYFEAAVCFIDSCNPLNYDIQKEPDQRKRRILVHCAMGISRSATITIAYLMSRANLLNQTEQQIMSHIQQQLQLLDEEIEAKIDNNCPWMDNEWKHESHEINVEVTKRTRHTYSQDKANALPSVADSTCDEKEIAKENTFVCVGLTLGEAYMFVLDRRTIICPNIGFCRQLSIWEALVWDTCHSTLYQIPFFRPDLNIKTKNGKQNGVQKDCQCLDHCCAVL